MKTTGGSGALALWIALLSIGSVANAAGPGAQLRGSADRLQRAAQIRAVRAGVAESAVEVAPRGEEQKLFHLLVPGAGRTSVYAPYQRVVFLSDGNPRLWDSLAEPIWQLYPDKTVVKGDYDIRATYQQGSFTAMHMDNRQRLPLASGSADLVIMRRGLCLCHGGTLCGGLRPDLPSIRRFFKDVYRLLDQRQPQAVAYLHGAHGGPARLEVFRRAADELMAQNPAMRVEFVQDQGGFSAVKLSHAQAALTN